MTHIVELSFRTFAYESTKEEWFTSWTIMYWAWWISWAPFVGLFIAKISRGRTIREFVVCVLLIPTVFNLLWMTVFGNGAIWMDAQTAGMLTQAAAETDRLLFLFLNQLPLPAITSLAAILVIAALLHTVDDFEPVCYFADGRRGYSLKYMRRKELLTDVLRQYERYIRMIANSKHNLYLFDKKNDET